MRLSRVVLINPAGNGANTELSYNSIKEFKTALNEMLYYSHEVYLFNEQDFEMYPYSQTNDIAQVVRDARFYEVPLFISVAYEPITL